MLLRYVPANPLNPEANPQLKEVWQEINVLLRDIAGTKEQTAENMWLCLCLYCQIYDPAKQGPY